jgi:glyoxylase-like metal-dependent hydrolase (beta-lactamase superfamily II)
MGAKRVINGVHVVPMGMANAFLIEGDDGLTLIDAGFPAKEAAVFGAINGIGRSADQLRHLVFTHGHPDHIGGAATIVRKTGARTYMHPLDISTAEWRPFSAYEAGTWSVGASAVQAVLRFRRANGARCHRPAFD